MTTTVKERPVDVQRARHSRAGQRRVSDQTVARLIAYFMVAGSAAVGFIVAALVGSVLWLVGAVVFAVVGIGCMVAAVVGDSRRA